MAQQKANPGKSEPPQPWFGGPRLTTLFLLGRPHHSEFKTVLLAYFKKPGRGWHGRTVELERIFGFGNGSYRSYEPFPKPKMRSSGRSGEVARVKTFFRFVKNRRLGHTVHTYVRGRGVARLHISDIICCLRSRIYLALDPKRLRQPCHLPFGVSNFGHLDDDKRQTRKRNPKFAQPSGFTRGEQKK